MENSSLLLRSLDPVTERHLFEVAYNWRLKPKRHTQPDRMPLEDFAATDPTQVVLGLFNGELQAVYLARDVGNARCELHYTCQRHTPREYLVWAGGTIVNWLRGNGWREVGVWLIPRNRAYVRMAEDCGLSQCESAEFEIDGKMTQFDWYAARADTK